MGEEFFRQQEPPGEESKWLFRHRVEVPVLHGLARSECGVFRRRDDRHYWNGVLMNHVKLAQKDRRVPVVECHSIQVARAIKDSGDIDCNFVYVRPPTHEDIEVRIIRNRFGSETKMSLATKMGKIRHEFSLLEQGYYSDLFKKILVNDLREKFLNRAGVEIGLNLYKFK
uniref:Uncharacterized protein n=1 Tax=Strombidium rassoulzadegani TaxID=1082188 RepID=A0A7S3CNJ0_9SPIT|mmetsp:Transcript_18397/g.31456  ORF Transcript_18397/g.31456 Transcript_18397/m.31456 type:complete len:170 (+) Transcript_18397:450-959(+)